MIDYIELGPDDVIREGDEIASEHNGKCMENWSPCTRTIGTRVGDLAHVSFRRPRSTLIRDAAIELLRDAYGDSEMTMQIGDDTYTTVRGSLLHNLRERIGVSVEELRGDA